MYRRNIDFHMIGNIPNSILEASPLESFSHTFVEQRLGAVLLIDADALPTDKLLMLASEGTEMFIIANEDYRGNLMCTFACHENVTISASSSVDLMYNFQQWQLRWKRKLDAWQTEHYLDTVINSSPNLIWFKDIKGIHEKVNDSFCQTVKKRREQIEGSLHAYIWDVEEEGPDCIASDEHAIQSRTTCTSDETVQTGDAERLLIAYKTPLFDRDGSVMGTVGIGVDVTAERTYASELAKKSDFLDTVFSSVDCGVLCHSFDGTRIYNINTAALEMLGYRSREEMLEDGFNIIAPTVVEEDKDALRQAIHSLKKVSDSIGISYSVKHKNGKLRHIIGNVKLIELNGEVVYQRFLLDCTDQRQQEKENERRQMELIHALSVEYLLVYFFDLRSQEGTLLRDPEGIGKILGARGSSLRDVVGTLIDKYVIDEDKEMIQFALSTENLREELANDKVYSVGFRAQTPSGDERFYQLKAVKAGTWDGHYGIAIGMSDIDCKVRTEMKKNTLLEESLQAANQASIAKSTFLSNMSHDIRTPMNAVIGFTTLAIRHSDNSKRVNTYLSKILESSKLMLQLINDVLDMTHIESGRMLLEEVPCSLNSILQNLRNIMLASIQEKQLELYMELIEVSEDTILCDELRLSQILLNLLSNAVKYSREGGTISVRVCELQSTRAGYGTYEFSIEDNGIGMSNDFLPHIFEPFERERNSTISGIQGTGLGMAIVKNIIDMMGGTITVQSEKGIGTTFTVTLTFKMDDKPIETEQVAAAEISSLSHTHVLVAEDNELNQEIILATLEEAGISADIAENGAVAVEMLLSSRPDYYSLVLMDIQMPVMNGYEAIKAIRASGRVDLEKIPIFAVTANAFEEDKQKAINCGMNGHIAKPIDIKNLLNTLDQVLK